MPQPPHHAGITIRHAGSVGTLLRQMGKPTTCNGCWGTTRESRHGQRVVSVVQPCRWMICGEYSFPDRDTPPMGMHAHALRNSDAAHNITRATLLLCSNVLGELQMAGSPQLHTRAVAASPLTSESTQCFTDSSCRSAARPPNSPQAQRRSRTCSLACIGSSS